MNEGVVERARELGRLLSQTPEYQALRRANQQLSDDPDGRQLVETLSRRHQEVMQHLERGQQPPEELRTSYEKAFESAQGHAAYQQLVAAQSNFDKVMQRINEEIAKGVEAGDQSRIILPD